MQNCIENRLIFSFSLLIVKNSNFGNKDYFSRKITELEELLKSNFLRALLLLHAISKFDMKKLEF